MILKRTRIIETQKITSNDCFMRLWIWKCATKLSDTMKNIRTIETTETLLIIEYSLEFIYVSILFYFILSHSNVDAKCCGLKWSVKKRAIFFVALEKWWDCSINLKMFTTTTGDEVAETTTNPMANIYRMKWTFELDRQINERKEVR